MIIINKINNHSEINKNLLHLIDKIPNNPLNKDNDFITHTDWNLPKNFKREYVEYFLNIIKPYMEKIAINLKSKNYNIKNIWFQQYLKSNIHGWHNHPDTNFTNVYFIELPSESLATQILNHDKLNVKEGDLLTFPAYLYHRSPLNTSDNRKTIISFNSNFYDFIDGSI
jgi:hypothetical protein